MNKRKLPRNKINGRCLKLEQVIERAGEHCAHCEAVTSLTLDHIMPRSKGGTHELDNLQLLCQKCNVAKADFIPTDYSYPSAGEWVPNAIRIKGI